MRIPSDTVYLAGVMAKMRGVKQSFQELTSASTASEARGAVDSGSTVTCAGIIMEPRKAMKIMFLSGNSILEKAYAAEADRISLPTMVMTAILMELRIGGEMTGYYEKGVSFLRTALSQAARRIFMCDSTKFGKVFSHHLCTVEDVDVVLCDKPLPEKMMERIGRNRPSSVLS